MREQKYPSVDETLVQGELGNGLSIYVMPKAEYNKSFAFFAANYGGCDRRFKLDGEWVDTPAGVAHFLEHKMFDTREGNALTRLSANGASPNAFTSHGMTAYYFSTAGNFEENLRELLSFVTIPYFTKESVEKEQGIIGQEIRMTEDDPGRAVYQNLLRALYGTHPVRDTICGTIDSIREITEQTLYDCHKVFYNPANMVLCAAGKVEAEQVYAIASELVQGAAQEIGGRDYELAAEGTDESREIEVRMEVSAPQFMIGARIEAEGNGEGYNRKQLLGELACSVMAGRSSPLYSRMYREGIINKNFVTGITEFPGGMAVIAGGESREIDKVAEAICGEAERIGREGIDRGLFNRLKKAYIGGHIRGLENIEGVCYSIAAGHFKGYNPLNGLELLQGIRAEEIEEFISGAIKRERIKISKVLPGTEKKRG